MTDDGADDPLAPVRALLRAAAPAEADPERVAAALAAIATERLVAQAGGADGLSRALANPALGPLVGHAGAELTDPETVPGAARVRLTVRDARGAPARFLVSLLRGPDRRWRVSGLRREEAGWS